MVYPYRELCLLGAILALMLSHSWAAAQPSRCRALCQNINAEDACQRCRLRVPLRFGKRNSEAMLPDDPNADDDPQLLPVAAVEIVQPLEDASQLDRPRGFLWRALRNYATTWNLPDKNSYE